jgi:cellulose synthase/poly-beta-1,6-N-acetylglucosamine synthase-like glycosyltransferase
MIWVVLFFASAAFILYVTAGYPMVLSALARLRPRPIRKDGEPKSVSVIIAVHNGARFIRDKLDSVLALDYPAELMDVLVVSDESTDETDDIVREYATRGIQLMRVPKGGKPAALNAAIPRVTGEILFLTDVRQTLEPSSLRRLVACFGDPQIGVTSGELLIRKGESRDTSDVGLYWRYESWIRNRLSSVDSMFGATGPFYTMRRELAVEMPPDILLDDMYLPMAAFFRGYRLVVEDTARAFDYPTTRDTEFRRKVRTLAGNFQMIRLFPHLLGPRNRMCFHYLSYKVGRLLLPYALLILAVSSFFLPAPWAAVSVSAQGLFYLLAAADPLVPQRFVLKRLTSPVNTFVTMMIAAVRAVSVFFVPPRSLWKVTNDVVVPRPR